MMLGNLAPRPRPRAFVFLALLLLTLVTGAARGQSNFGSLRGTVTDANGAAIPGAAIKVTDTGTGQVLDFTTNDDGVFTAAGLRPVVYDISVEKEGFKTTSVNGVKIDTAKDSGITIVLDPGTVSEQVTVTSEAPILQTENGAVTKTVDQRTIVEVPLNGRNTLELALTLPGATGSAGSEFANSGGSNAEVIAGREIIVNGGRPGTTQFYADGANVTSIALGRTSVSFTPDTIQEFSVQQSNYSAQYSQAGGAIIQQTTKSGTNEYHGAVYWFHRQKALTANPFNSTRLEIFDNDARPPLRRQQVGANIGGPVALPWLDDQGLKLKTLKNRTFFFFSYEPTRQLVSDLTLQFVRVPTDRELAGDFSQSLVYNANGTTRPFAQLYRQFDRLPDGTLIHRPNPGYRSTQPLGPNNPLFQSNFTGAANLFNPNDPDPNRRGRVLVDANGVSYVNPVAQRLARDLFPRPNIPFITSGPNAGTNYVYARKTLVEDDRYTVRIDQRVTDAHNVYGRYTYQPIFNDRFFREPVGLTDISDLADARQVLLGWTGALRPNLVNEFRASYVFGKFTRDFPSSLADRDLTTEYLDIGGRGVGLPNAIGFGSADFFQGSQPRNDLNQSSGRSFDRLGSRNPQNVGRNTEHTFQLSDDVTWTRGDRTYRFGAQGSVYMLNQANLGFGQLAGGRYNYGNAQTADRNCSASPFAGNITNCPTGTANGGDTFASFLLGMPSGLQLQSENLSSPYYYRWANLGLYLQHDWKVRQNLTLNLGLRWQYQSPRWEKYDFQAELNLDPGSFVENPFAAVRNPATGTFYPTATSTTVGLPAGVARPLAPVVELSGRDGRSRYLTEPQYGDFEPRIGFAWTPDFAWNRDRRFVLRGGYGLQHANLLGNDREPLPIIGSQTVTTNPTSFGGSYFYRSPSLVTGVVDEGSPNISDITCGLAICDDPRIPFQLGFNNQVIRPDPSLNIPPSGGLVRPGDLTRPTRNGLVRQDPRYRSVSFIGDPDYHTPVIQNYSLQAQYEFIPGNVITVGYQGSRGTHLFGPMYDINRVDPFIGRASQPYPGYSGRFGFNGIYVISPTNRASTYHAATFEFQRRFTRGLQFNFNYTFSKSLDDSSGGVTSTTVNLAGDVSGFDIPIRRNQNPYDSRAERAVSSYDTPHVFNLTALWELPFGRGKRFLNEGGVVNALIGDWQVTTLARSRSGYPVSVGLGQSNSFDLGTFQGSQRPNLVPGVPLRNPDWTPENANTVSYVNPRAFAWPEPGRYGNAPRNFSQLRFPWVNTFDGSIIKRLKPFRSETRYFELRVEAFNLFNHRVLTSNGVSTDIFSSGGQNRLLDPAQLTIPGVQNRYANLTVPGVWEAIIAKSQGDNSLIANLPGTAGVRGACNVNTETPQVPIPGVPGQTSTRGVLTPACVATELNLNGNFFRLQQNAVPSRIIQLGIKFYF